MKLLLLLIPIISFTSGCAYQPYLSIDEKIARTTAERIANTNQANPVPHFDDREKDMKDLFCHTPDQEKVRLKEGRMPFDFPVAISDSKEPRNAWDPIRPGETVYESWSYSNATYTFKNGELIQTFTH